MGAILSFAVQEGLIDKNPARIDRGADGERRTIIEGKDQYARLFATLERGEREGWLAPMAATAIRLIALTGARRSEITRLRWSWVDLKAGIVRIPADQHKGRRAGQVRVVSLPAAAQAILAGMEHGDRDALVISSAKPGAEIVLTKPWAKVRAEAGLPPDLGLHGLRHSIGSHAAMAGMSAAEIQAVLGHRDYRTSQKYVHFAEQARSTAAERAAAIVSAALTGKDEAADIVKLPNKV